MQFSAMFVSLSVCLLARLLKNLCIDLDDILHVDRCRDIVIIIKNVKIRVTLSFAGALYTLQSY